MSFARIPVSIGELIDKITILTIKLNHQDSEELKKELDVLINIAYDLSVFNTDDVMNLTTINMTLWDLENQIRKKEKKQEFDDEFIQIARKIYETNDKRSEYKKKINLENNSTYKEIKIYKS